MHRSVFVAVLGIVFLGTLPELASAQYLCPVSIDLKGKPILDSRIRDAARPSTDQLWEALANLSFSPTAEGKNLPDPQTAKKTTLKGQLRVKIDGAGEVAVEELRLVQNRFNDEAWVLEPAEVTRILELRRAAAQPKPK